MHKEKKKNPESLDWNFGFFLNSLDFRKKSLNILECSD